MLQSYWGAAFSLSMFRSWSWWNAPSTSIAFGRRLLFWVMEGLDDALYEREIGWMNSLLLRCVELGILFPL